MTTSHRNLLPSHMLAQSLPYQQYFAFAEAYLDSAQRLCSVLARSTRSATFERGAVVLYLTQHALELFYKGAILRREPSERLSHGLQQLRRRYLALYPAKRFHIPAVFATSYEHLTIQQIAQAQGLEPPLDQLYRYPEDKKGSPWRALLSFEASSFSRELAALWDGFSRAQAEISNSFGSEP